MIVGLFPVISRDGFGLILGSVLGSMFVRFGVNFWSFWKSTGRQNVNKKRSENWHRKK
jgi:hypothetical protein